METIILTIHVLLAVAIIILVLLQQGKGANLGASFGGGASNTVFGSRGSVSFFAKLTSFAIAIFFVTSMVLAWAAQQRYYGQASGVNQLLETLQQNTGSGEVLPGEQQPAVPGHAAPQEAEPGSGTQTELPDLN